MNSNFVHLHNHTEYSFLDGAIRIKDMVAKAQSQGASALAITDHGGLFGAMEFYYACNAKNIKPLLGFEAYVAPGTRFDKGQSPRHHLVLLAKNNVGWKNIMKLSSIGYQEGFYYKPRIDEEVLRAHSEGIIATSACIGGSIQQALLRGDRDRAIEVTDTYLDIFGEGNFFYELHKHGIDDEEIIMPQMIDLAQEKGVPMVVANDAHYLNKEDADAHAVLLCMQTQNKLSDPNRYQFTGDQFYLKSPEEMSLLFPNVPEAMSNTQLIADMCDVVEPENEAQMPSIGVPDEYKNIQAYDEIIEMAAEVIRKGNGGELSPEMQERLLLEENKYLIALAIEGAQKIYGNPYSQEVKERLEYELSIIISMGFPGYYLIVMDFLLQADKMGIMRGVRGSAAGSLVGYVIGISNVCPLKYGLIFERFLNPERASMPDVDADLADADRQKVIEYCIDKYGKEAVCQIINFGRMMSKAAVKDVARVLEVSVQDAQRLSNLIPQGSTIQAAIDESAELQEELKRNSLHRQVFDYALKLEGMARQPGMHAAGVIIAPGDVSGWAPLFKQTGADGATMSQFDMKYIEQTGMIKMDFLGLRTLTVLQNAIKMIKKNHDVDIDIWVDIQDGDELTYKEIFHKGNTVEIFQFESPGMRKYLKQLQAQSIEDLIAMTSLYRPGPMENIGSFINRRHGKEPIEYPHIMLKDILDVTYGIIIYQEQVMQIARDMGGFSMGQADILRKAMGKKKLDVMEKMKAKFVVGATEKGIDEKSSTGVWDLMAEFAKYGFNKAHACVYAHVSYQSAYLKAHYPQEYMAAVITSRMGDNDKFVSSTDEAKRMGIEILPPDVNASFYDCGVYEGKITIGLGAIANVGKAAGEIIKTREESGEKFEDIYELCSSVNLKDVSKKALECLVYAGACDSLTGNRAQLCAAIDSSVDYGKREQRDRELGQTSLFGGDEEDTLALPKPELPDAPEWEFFDQLAKEKEVLNFYVSGHPLEMYRDEVNAISTMNFSQESLKTVKEGDLVHGRRKNRETRVIGGMITTIKKMFSKKDGRPMAFLGFEDFYGEGEVIVWPDKYEDVGEYCVSEAMVLVKGEVECEADGEGETARRKGKIYASRIIPLEDARDDWIKSLHITINSEALTENGVAEVMSILEAHKGGCGVMIHLRTASSSEHKIIAQGVSVSVAPEVLKELRSLSVIERVHLSQKKVALKEATLK